MRRLSAAIVGLVLGFVLGTLGTASASQILGRTSGSSASTSSTNTWAQAQTFSSYVLRSTATLTASGGLGVTPITTDIVLVTAGDGAGVTLPTPNQSGQQVLVICAIVNGTTLVYPHHANATISNASAGNPITVRSSAGAGAILFTDKTTGTTGNWVASSVYGPTSSYDIAINGGNILTQRLTTDNMVFGNTSGHASIDLGAGTNNNKITFPASTVIAAWLGSGTTHYLDVTTNSGGLWTFQKPFTGAIATPVAAAGTDNTNCGAIPAGTVQVSITGADGTKGVCLPTTSSIVTCVRVMSQVVGALTPLKVYGAAADTNPTVNGGAGAAAYSQLGGSSLLYCNSGVAWTSY